METQARELRRFKEARRILENPDLDDRLPKGLRDKVAAFGRGVVADCVRTRAPDYASVNACVRWRIDASRGVASNP